MKRFIVGVLIGIAIGAATHSLTAGFVLRNQRVSTTTGARSLTNDELAQAVMADGDRIEAIQSELTRLRTDNQKMRKDLEEMESGLIQFKNLYFRRF
ncbi:hypothetical protein EBR57_06060 [bacterium]|nr:hypothetical protein [bacterium]